MSFPQSHVFPPSSNKKSLHESACGCLQCRLSEPAYCIVCDEIYDWQNISDYDIENGLDELCEECKKEKQKVIRKIKKKQTELAKRLKKPTGLSKPRR